LAADGPAELAGRARAVRFSQWTSRRSGWDHDHCAFCHAEIAATKPDHVDFTAGYVSADDNYTWICPPCFEDFKAQFRWTVLPTPAES
jgi:hypothetical protein